jgi:hypothetical protein
LDIFFLVDSGINDEVADTAASLEDLPVKLLTLDDLFGQCSVTYDTDKAAFDFDNIHIPDALKNGNVVNRIVGISEGTLSRLDSNSDTVNRGMVNGALRDVLKRTGPVWGMPGLYSSVGHSFSLPLQWERVADALPELDLPSFMYGIAKQDIDASGMAKPLWKSPFNMLDWSSAAAEEVERNKFVVDMPAGTPVIFYFVGEACAGFALRPGYEIPKDIADTKSGWIQKVRMLFDASAGEILVMVDEGNLTFMAFSHSMGTSVDDPSFKSIVSQGVAGLAGC